MESKPGNKNVFFYVTIILLAILVLYLVVGIPALVNIHNDAIVHGQRSFWTSDTGSVVMTVFVPFVLIILSAISAIISVAVAFFSNSTHSEKMKSVALLMVTLSVTVPILIFAFLLMLI